MCVCVYVCVYVYVCVSSVSDEERSKQMAKYLAKPNRTWFLRQGDFISKIQHSRYCVRTMMTGTITIIIYINASYEMKEGSHWEINNQREARLLQDVTNRIELKWQNFY